MSHRLACAALTSVLLIGPSPLASAQSATPDEARVHTAASLGFSKAWDDEGGIGTGAEVGGTVGWLATDHLELLASVSTLAHDRPTPFLSWDGRVWMLSARVAYAPRARHARVRPFVAGGLGLMRSSGSITERGSTGPFSRLRPEIVDVRNWTYTGPLWEVGGGAELQFGRMFVRPEAWWTVGMLDRGARIGVPEPPITVTRIVLGAGVRF